MKNKKSKINYRKIMKKRVENGLDYDEFLKPYDPWMSSYQKNFGKGDNQIMDISQALSIKSIQKTNTLKNEDKENSLNYKDSLDQLKKEQKNKSKQSRKQSMKTSQKFKKMKTEEFTENKLQSKNDYGCLEKWLDPKDIMRNPVFVRLVNRASRNNFLGHNLKFLINQKNEYYPFLGGKCLCGYCICGNCKCVHFKYKKGPVDPSEFKTIYNKDFVPWEPQKIEKYKMKPETLIFPLKKDFQTQYQKDYQKRKPYDAKGLFSNKSRRDNINPFKKLKAPQLQTTLYHLDYPNWKTNRTKAILPFNASENKKKLPFRGFPVSKEIGEFYQGEVPKKPKRENMEKEKNNPLGPEIDINYTTTMKDDYADIDPNYKEEVEKRVPFHNLMTGHPTNKPQFSTSYQKYGQKISKLKCPMIKDVNRIKRMLRDYAINHGMPY